MYFTGLERGRYRVIYADPPWQFRTWSHRGEGRSAVQHYRCMTLEDICDLPVADLAAADAVLFLWVIQSMLPQAQEVIRAWGFEFKTVAFCWVKMPAAWDGRSMGTRIGMGYHTRSGFEQCWLATRGKGYIRQDKGVRQVLHAPAREHSRKPDEIATRIERLVGEVPRIELFARGPRSGWDVWGNEANATAQGQGMAVTTRRKG